MRISEEGKYHWFISPRPVIAGVDEAGRGALAGPVVAAACILNSSALRRKPRCVRITDSKVLTPEEREEAYRFLVKTCSWGIGIVEANIVDAEGILTATEHAMQRAVMHLPVRPTYLLIDGRDHFWFDIPHSSIIRGDSLERCIAAASIIAKVTRDRLMVRSDAIFPGFQFSSHKGYGTATHLTAIRQHGVVPGVHRRTFLPLSCSLPSSRAFCRVRQRLGRIF